MTHPTQAELPDVAHAAPPVRFTRTTHERVGATIAQLGMSVRILEARSACCSSCPRGLGKNEPCPLENEFTVTASDYDNFANAYSAENESNLFNAYYERPAMLGLAGEVSGRRILDAGCGSGPLSAALRARGAVVTGLDVSAAMIDLARQRLVKTPTCTSRISARRCRSLTPSSMTSSHPSSCTTWRTGPAHSRSCVGC